MAYKLLLLIRNITEWKTLSANQEQYVLFIDTDFALEFAGQFVLLYLEYRRHHTPVAVAVAALTTLCDEQVKDSVLVALASLGLVAAEQSENAHEGDLVQVFAKELLEDVLELMCVDVLFGKVVLVVQHLR